MNDIRLFTITVAREAGALLADQFGGEQSIDFKGAIDIVTETDRLSEALIMKRITSSYPGQDILTEESAAIDTGSDCRWIIDPLDGTTNYAHGFPFFCVSIAFERAGTIMVGVVFDPLRNELFVAEKGKGAFLNESSLQVSRTNQLSNSLLATGFPYDIRVNPDNNLNHFNALATKARAIRRAGSAALDLSYLAAGRFDGFWELRLRPWDTAAGTLIVTEAGGVVSELDGQAHHLDSPTLAASNGLIHDAMLTALAESHTRA